MQDVSNISNTIQLYKHNMDVALEKTMGLIVIATFFLNQEEMIELLIEVIDFLAQENNEVTELAVSLNKEVEEQYAFIKEIASKQDSYREEYTNGAELLGEKIEYITNKVIIDMEKKEQIKIKAAEARHGEMREIRKQVIKEWEEYKAEQAALGRTASKNKFAKKAAKKYRYSENTIRKNWLQGI